MADYTRAELMVAAAAREIRNEEIVFVGMRLPLVTFVIAKRTHAPDAIGVFEAGLVRDHPAEQPLHTMGDSPNVAGALWVTGLWEVMSYLQRGEVDLGFIGGAEVEVFGNLNTSYGGNAQHPTVKLPGSGGAADLITDTPHSRKSVPACSTSSRRSGRGTQGRRRHRYSTEW